MPQKYERRSIGLSGSRRAETIIIFGLNPDNDVRLAPINELSKGYDSSIYLSDYAEYGSTGLSRGWTSRWVSGSSYLFHLRELDLTTRTEYPVSSSDISAATTHNPYWTCYPQSDSRASAVFGSNRSYFVQQCTRNDGYSQGTGALIRADLSGGTWANTLDVIGLDYNTTALAADPSTDGLLYAGKYLVTNPAQTTTHIDKAVVSGSTVTVTSLQTINGIPGVTGLAFGLPSADVQNPSDIPELKAFSITDYYLIKKTLVGL